MKGVHLLLVLLSLVIDDVEEAELIDTLGGGDDTEPVTELLLLEELLGTTWPSASIRQALPFSSEIPEDKHTGT